MADRPDISNDAVQKATGKSWESWFGIMDELGGADHTERAKRLQAAYPDLSGWWCQGITVEYERARGLRARHETTSGFQVSVQRSLPLDAEAAWSALEAAPMVAGVHWSEGERFEIEQGTSVTVRAVRPPKLLRLWWHAPTGRSTVTAEFLTKAAGTTVLISHTSLASRKEVEEFRVRWRGVLERIADGT